MKKEKKSFLVRHWDNKILRNISALSLAAKTIRRNSRQIKCEDSQVTLPLFIKEGSVCFDIGASYGRYSYAMSRLAGSTGKIYSFEPSRFSLRVFNYVKSFHRLKNVIPVNKGISSRDGEATLFLPIKGNGRLGVSLAYIGDDSGSPEFVTEENIQITSIDAFCRQNNIERLDFIKCDIEGGEAAFVDGAKDVLKKFRPVVLCEIEGEMLTKQGKDVRALYNSVASLNYRTFIDTINSEGKLAFEKVDDFSRDDNYIFIPSESPLIEAVSK